MDGRHRLDYAPFIGDQAIERILVKAKQLRVLHISSTFYGGGVAEMLSSSTLLARNLGLRADWRLIQGTPDFLNVTKKLHNAHMRTEFCSTISS